MDTCARLKHFFETETDIGIFFSAAFEGTIAPMAKLKRLLSTKCTCAVGFLTVFRCFLRLLVMLISSKECVIFWMT